MKKAVLIFSLFVLTTTSVLSQQSDFPKLTGPYLGQNPPKMTPEIFASGIISLGFHEHSLTISPDGKEIFFVSASSNFSKYLIMYTWLEKDEWSMPIVAPFSGVYLDLSPSFSPDGKRLYFASIRPLTETEEPKKDFDIWFVERENGGWSEPKNVGSPINTYGNEVSPAFMSDGSMAFQYIEKLGSLTWDLYISHFSDGKYSPPEKYPSPINTEFNEAAPYIVQDGSYILFNSNRPHGQGIMSIFVSFKNEDGSWNEPINLREKFFSNPLCGDWGPVISPDGKYIFFSSFRNNDPIEPKSEKYFEQMEELLGVPLPGKGTLYWIDIGILEEYRPID
ncbi:MAG: hypothetical protein A2V66_16075 [Ignavibacteria bacterium RBG_13_36_8]|nr:MAG: hypothetical protein A2V66_16075 [Ignavibacteria bacterium RBG_13_36_8]